MKPKKRIVTHQQMNGMNWRYKKNTPPTEEPIEPKVIPKTVIKK